MPPRSKKRKTSSNGTTATAVTSESTEIDELRNELKLLREEIHKLSNKTNSHTKEPRGIFLLPDEILLIVLEYVNQMDTFHLALTHRNFEKVCRAKLFKSIYVYQETDPKISINIPKKLYTAFYMKYTIIGHNSFLKMISSIYYKAELTKEVMFSNPGFVSVNCLDFIKKSNPKCAIVIGDMSYHHTNAWMITQQNTTTSKYHWLSIQLEDDFPEEFTSSVKHLVVEDLELCPNISTKFKLLESIKIKQHIGFANPPPMQTIVCPIVHIPSPDFLRYFDIRIITQLLIIRTSTTALDQGYIANASGFTSLKVLHIDMEREPMTTFLNHLPKHSLTEIHFGADIYQCTAPAFERAIDRHRDSLKVLGFSSLEELGYRRGCLYWKKYFEFRTENNFLRGFKHVLSIDPINYPMLEKIVGSRQVLIVDRLPYPLRLVPLEFFNDKDNKQSKTRSTKSNGGGTTDGKEPVET